MRKISSILLLVCIVILSQSCAKKSKIESIAILPTPQQIDIHEEVFSLSKETKIYYNNAILKETAEQITDILPLEDSELLEDNSNEKGINLVYNSSASIPLEGYLLDINKDGVFITASTTKGIYYGLTSFYQILGNYSPPEEWEENFEIDINHLQIKDAPKYPYRGVHLDVSRHFFSKEEVMKYIEMLSFQKINTFHWHLTDDQGWRIEIKKYPKLTSVGSIRSGTLIGHGAMSERDGKPFEYDSVEVSGYYTQEDIKEVVAYAKTKHVTIIPEIELPGHASAATKAYPNLSCKPKEEKEVIRNWGIFEDVFCPTEEVFTFLENVLSEVITLFPSEVIHIGGDEIMYDYWKESPVVKQIMKKHNYTKIEQIQSYFIERIGKFLKEKNKTFIAWDDVLESKSETYPDNLIIMSWRRGDKSTLEALKHNLKVILTPNDVLYFDFYQGDPKTEPLAIGGFTDINKILEYDPLEKLRNMPDIDISNVIGFQANIWSEYIKTPEHLEYMAYPRITALAQKDWVGLDSKDSIPKFLQDIKTFQKFYDFFGFNYCKACIK